MRSTKNKLKTKSKNGREDNTKEKQLASFRQGPVAHSLRNPFTKVFLRSKGNGLSFNLG